MKRIEKNDPVTLREVGKTLVSKGDYIGAFEYWTKAAGLGDAAAYFELSGMYYMGQGVEKDEKMELYHLEEAAIGGHPDSRYHLSYYEVENVMIDRAVRHLTIAANLGFDKSIQTLKTFYVDGEVSKGDFAAALRAHQAAVDATKSPQRELAQKVRNFKV